MRAPVCILNGMPTLSRRRFLAALATAAPIGMFVRRAHAAAVHHVSSDPATLDALAEAILPSALGKAGRSRAVAAFREWGAHYHESAELVHGYGTSRLRFTGPTPLTRWAQQLDALEAAALRVHGVRWSSSTVEQRRGLVRSAVQGQRLERMPAPADAGHVAVALLAHFYESPAATDLCYQAQIHKTTCRPLAASAKKPLPLIMVSDR